MNETYIVTIPFGTIDKQCTHLGNATKDAVKDLKTAYSNKDIDVVKQKSVELHVSGTKHFKKWVEVALTTYFTSVHRSVPHCIGIINSFYKRYQRIDDDYMMTNDQMIRNFVFYLNWIITHSDRKDGSDKLMQLLKMEKDDYNLTLLRHNNFLVSRNLDAINPFLIAGDPKELILPLSEISVLLSDPATDKREFKLCYWASWIIHYEKLYHKGSLTVPSRQTTELESAIGSSAMAKVATDWIVIVFHLFIHYTKTYPNDVKRTIIQLIELFTTIYKGKKKKLEYILYVTMIRWILRPNGYPSIDSELLSNANAHASVCNYAYSGITIIDP
jgi:hypothetical protein